MKRNLSLVAIATLVSVGGALLGGCGSSGHSAASTVTQDTGTTTGAAPASTTPTTTTPPPTTTTPTTTGPAAGANGGTPAPGTRTVPGGPAFTHPGSSGGVSAASAVLHAHGYTPASTADYHPGQTLAVLVGVRQGSADAHVQQAFFFVNGRFVGTDTRDPSAQIRVTGQSDTSVTLSYGLYRPRDALCCPSGGDRSVRFQLDNGHLAPLDPIPSASATAALSRQ